MSSTGFIQLEASFGIATFLNTPLENFCFQQIKKQQSSESGKAGATGAATLPENDTSCEWEFDFRIRMWDWHRRDIYIFFRLNK